MRLSPNLDARPSKGKAAGKMAIHCTKCGHEIGPCNEPWKPRAVLRERPMREISPTYTTGPDVQLREFFCPGCLTLLDSETALPGDPFLNDIVYAGDRTR